jgi:hypothetical protein
MAIWRTLRLTNSREGSGIHLGKVSTMRRLFLAALGVFAVAGVASAQQPQYQQPPIQYPAQYPTVSPGAVAATPVQPTAGATVIQGSGGCSNCGPTTGSTTGKVGHNFTMSNVTGGNCLYGYRCQNGCGSIKSDLAFQFGTCAQFFSPCGPTCGGLFKKQCGTTPFSAPFGTGWGCPRQYDTYTNH